MKKYLARILIVTLLLGSGLVGCGQKSEPPSYYPSARYDDKDMIYELYDYFNERYFSGSWARPRFPLDKWSASYDKAEGIWLVKAYDNGGSYAGTWSVPESSIYGEGVIEPYDEKARAIESGLGKIAQMPPRPSFVKFNDPGEKMIQAVQMYIANMSPAQVTEWSSFPVIQKLIRSYYPLDWHITYTDSEWIVATVYYEYKVVAYIDPHTGEIDVFDLYGSR